MPTKRKRVEASALGPASAGPKGRNSLPLRLKIPEPSSRPGESPNFENLVLSDAGAVSRPDTDTPPGDMQELCYSLIRVLDDSGVAYGAKSDDVNSRL